MRLAQRRSTRGWLAGLAGVAVAILGSGAAAPGSAGAASYRDTVLADGPLAYYRLNESGPPSLLSQVGSGTKDGIYGGSPSFGQPGALTGDSDPAVLFHGVNASPDFGEAPAAAVPRNDFSLEFWVNSTDTRGTGTQWYQGRALVDADVSGQHEDYGVSLLNNKVAFGVGLPDKTLQGSTTINDGNWHHVVVTRTNSTGAMVVYVDGAQDGSTTGPTGTRSAPTKLRIARSADDATLNPLNGRLDEVATYDKVLSAADVTRHFQTGTTTPSSATGPGPDNGPPGTGTGPFVSGFASSIAQALAPSSACQPGLSTGNRVVINSALGQPAIPIFTRGAAFASITELPFAFGRARLANARGARRHKRKLGLIKPVTLEAWRVGSYQIPLTLTSKGLKALQRRRRRHGLKASVAKLIQGDKIQLTCRPDQLPLVPLTNHVAVPGGAPGAVIPAFGGGRPFGTGTIQTFTIRATTLSAEFVPSKPPVRTPSAPLAPAPPPGRGGFILSGHGNASQGNGGSNVRVAFFDRGGGAIDVLSISGTAAGPGGTCGAEPFATASGFGQIKIPYRVAGNGSFNTSINQGPGGAPNTFILFGGLSFDARGRPSASVFVSAGHHSTFGGRLFSCTSQTGGLTLTVGG